MMNAIPPAAEAVEVYHSLLAQVYSPDRCNDSAAADSISAMQLQECWLRGRLGSSGATLHHGDVRILDYGEWNTDREGPCFRHAQLDIAGQRLYGDIQLDLRAEDWETQHRSENSAFNAVLLHIVLQTPPENWYTRSADDRDIPLMVLDSERVENALGRALRSKSKNRFDFPATAVELPIESIHNLLYSAAAHRCALKRRSFCERAHDVGRVQAWYEAWAETLGYGGNSLAMLQLARRVPFCELTAGGQSQHAIAMLMGAAGFMVPIMPERATDSERAYHKELWTEWWQHRERLHSAYPLHWQFASVRPFNHPHRRIAALAISAQSGCFTALSGKMNAAHARDLVQTFSKLTDSFWSKHYSLYAPERVTEARLVGSGTIRRFLVNHVLPQEESAEAWELYLSLKADSIPHSVRRASRALFGGRTDISPEGKLSGDILRLHYVQQALLQLQADFDLESFSADTIE